MKTLIKILVVALVIAALFQYWPQIMSQVDKLLGTAPAAPASIAAAPSPQTSSSTQESASAIRLDLSPRKWTNPDGRSFEGSLVSVKNDQVIIRRNTDSAFFQISAHTLSTEDQAYLQKQVSLAGADGAGFVDHIPGVYTLSRKIPVRGYVVRLPDRSVIGGWRHDRVDPMFWLLLSEKLHGTDSGSILVRVDEKTYNAHAEKNLITLQQLANFTDAKGQFSESLPWSRPHTTLIDGKYGSPNVSFNVTHKLMGIAARGGFPVQIDPSIFGFDPHKPESWELTVSWRTATGEISRTLRDGSVLTWP
ncbi:MAG TPA: hypothetical protein VK968_07595 [Roseimicrobium sp.]|nr:hypothetical protein [Roseimicrobium sp.]